MQASDHGRGLPRVLFVIPVGVRGGAGEVALNLIVCAAAGGYVAHAAVLVPGPLTDRLSRVGVPLEVLDAGRFRDIRGVRRTQRAIRALIERWQIDLVFSTEAKAHLYAAQPARRAGVAALYRQPSAPTWASAIDPLAAVLPGAGVVVASRYVAQRQRRLPRRPIHVVAPGIDLDRFTNGDGLDLRRQHEIPADAPLFGIVGRLQAWKGQDIFLRAASRVREVVGDARFVVVGGATMGWDTDDYARRLRALASDLGLDDVVTFTGEVDDAAGWLSAADVATCASDHEPFGLVALEAMASGSAFVTVPGGGPEEIVDDGVTGYVASGRTPEQLGDAMIRAHEHADRGAVVAAARRTLELKYSRERFAADIGQLVRAAVR
jgi:glycosyltransferase involved in cell wall biosynthesis